MRASPLRVLNQADIYDDVILKGIQVTKQLVHIILCIKMQEPWYMYNVCTCLYPSVYECQSNSYNRMLGTSKQNWMALQEAASVLLPIST